MNRILTIITLKTCMNNIKISNIRISKKKNIKNNNFIMKTYNASTAFAEKYTEDYEKKVSQLNETLRIRGKEVME